MVKHHDQYLLTHPTPYQPYISHYGPDQMMPTGITVQLRGMRLVTSMCTWGCLWPQRVLLYAICFVRVLGSSWTEMSRLGMRRITDVYILLVRGRIHSSDHVTHGDHALVWGPRPWDCKNQWRRVREWGGNGGVSHHFNKQKNAEEARMWTSFCQHRVCPHFPQSWISSDATEKLVASNSWVLGICEKSRNRRFLVKIMRGSFLEKDFLRIDYKWVISCFSRNVEFVKFL